MNNNPKEELHKNREIEDKISFIGELEHLRAHALRSASVAELNSQNADTDQERAKEHGNAIALLTWAEQAKQLRRRFMQDNFPEIPDSLWCMCKSAARLKQLAYEITLGDLPTLRQIDALADDVWSNATDTDLTGCTACAADKAVEKPLDSLTDEVVN